MFTATSPTGATRQFYDTSQFTIFRRAGWVSNTIHDEWADETIQRLDKMSDTTLRHFAPMACGDAYRDELHRRQYPEASERSVQG